MKPTDNLHKKAANLLVSCGLKKTGPRLAILAVLLEADKPMTQEQIAERLDPAAPDKTTIYRSLMKLVEHNLVHLAYIQERAGYFETAHHCRADQCHPHFTCVQCHETHCLHETLIPDVKNIPSGFIVQHRQLRLEGICADCQKLSANGKDHEK